MRAAAKGRPLPATRATGVTRAAATAMAAGPHRPPRRRWLPVVAAALLLLVGGLLVVWRPWAGPSIEDRIVCARDMTVRDQPRSRTVIATLYRDTWIQVYDDSPVPGWARTDLADGRHGWVLTQFLGPPCRR